LADAELSKKIREKALIMKNGQFIINFEKMQKWYDYLQYQQKMLDAETF